MQSLSEREALPGCGTFDKALAVIVRILLLYMILTVYIVLALAASDGHQVTPVDIKGVNLNAKLKSVQVHMSIPSHQVYKQLHNMYGHL